MYTGDMLGGVSEIQAKKKQVKLGSHDRKPDEGVMSEYSCRALANFS